MCFSSYIVHRATNTIDFRVMEYMASVQKQMTYLTDISHFISAKSSTRFSTKSTVTIFTNWTKEYRLELNIAVKGIPIPTVNSPKNVCVSLDRLYSFTPPTTAIIVKIQSRNKILK